MRYDSDPEAAREEMAQDIAKLEAALETLRANIEQHPWLRPLKGGYPETEIRDTLPTAAREFGYQIITQRGTPDVTYQCLRNAGGAWGWRVIATG